eukprot:Unigene11883_Nuclearia_a/m.36184 Unigene11883_Nuclearia_a/g.36184  ORF Unigene11883_Nuclearia_a/g.36184 Unigene11883_Nuclearia_a/m.36184 type:complete len:377 (-) Unigene11883_Nuclearia_a:1673-2803(-)
MSTMWLSSAVEAEGVRRSSSNAGSTSGAHDETKRASVASCDAHDVSSCTSALGAWWCSSGSSLRRGVTSRSNSAGRNGVQSKAGRSSNMAVRRRRASVRNCLACALSVRASADSAAAPVSSALSAGSGASPSVSSASAADAALAGTHCSSRMRTSSGSIGSTRTPRLLRSSPSSVTKPTCTRRETGCTTTSEADSSARWSHCSSTTRGSPACVLDRNGSSSKWQKSATRSSLSAATNASTVTRRDASWRRCCILPWRMRRVHCRSCVVLTSPAFFLSLTLLFDAGACARTPSSSPPIVSSAVRGPAHAPSPDGEWIRRVSWSRIVRSSISSRRIATCSSCRPLSRQPKRASSARACCRSSAALSSRSSSWRSSTAR